MRAYAIDSFGEPGSVREVPNPELLEGQVLIRVRAAGINAFDTSVISGRAKDYMEHRFPLIPGVDVAGVVEAVGPNVDGVAIGDEVFGADDKGFAGAGTLAEFVALSAKATARRPASIDATGAAALPTAGLTALSAVELAELKPAQTVVILGATGGVGSYATQLAVAARANVVAVTRGEHADYARELGAVDTIDYTSEDVAEVVRQRYRRGIAALLDFAGDRDLVAKVGELVRSGGRVCSSLGAADVDALASRRVRGLGANRAPLDRLADLARFVEEGRLRPPHLAAFPLERAAEAFELQATRHVRGKIVVTVA